MHKWVSTIFLTLTLSFYPGLLLSQANTDSLINVIESSESEVERDYARVLLAFQNLMPGPMADSARILLEKSNRLSIIEGYPVESAAWFNASGNYNWIIRNYDSAIICYSKTLAIADIEQIESRRSAAAVNIGALYRMLGFPDSSRYYLNKALYMFEEVADSAGIANTHASLARLYRELDNYELSLGYFLKAMEYQESVNDSLALLFTYNSVGILYSDLGNHRMALNYYHKSLEINEVIRIISTFHTIYGNMANSYLSLNEPDKAIESASRALEYQEIDFSIGGILSSYTNIANAYIMKGNYEEAGSFFEKAAEIENQIASPHHLAGFNNSYGDFLILIGDFENARLRLNQVLISADNIQSNLMRMKAAKSLFRLDSLMGNYLSAITNLQIYINSKDSIWVKERSDRLAELEIIYQTRQKETENQMLRESNLFNEEIIRSKNKLVIAGMAAAAFFALFLLTVLLSRVKLIKQRDRLKELNREISESRDLVHCQKLSLQNAVQTKDKLMSVIAHDLRGAYSSLIGYLELLSLNYEKYNDEKRKSIITTLHHNSLNTFNMLSNLLDWSVLMRGRVLPKPVSINLKGIADTCFEMLEFEINLKEHNIVNSVDPLIYLNADSKMLKSILFNLIKNAIKYTPRNGEIRVKTSEANGFMVISIIDTGVGIPEEKVKSLLDSDNSYRESGTENEQGTGLGLLISREFINMMGGELIVESEPDKGSTFSFTFPVKFVTRNES